MWRLTEIRRNVVADKLPNCESYRRKLRLKSVESQIE